ncbi:SDR family oxidoreductase [Mucilaginibacter sp. L196]|uniref:SDR family NAD(P)-dependent oxidoreductase n=1 Tax=Mucilaginibacter sp. L196 TaxID=1641870 RepID=UPI00131E1838|nr:SDR family oxidoreductase [Mucilaginibacter sp. L196]
MDLYAIITGASKGIGREISVLLAKKGYKLILIARSAPELEELATKLPGEALYFTIDLSEVGAAKKVAEFCKNLPVSILVNNAGYGLWGNFDESDIGQQLNMLQLNINAVIELTYYLLPQLKKQPSYILNVSSTAAYQAVPTLALYAASKAFILSFSRALRIELKGSVSVSCLCPGPTDTGFAKRAGMDSLAELAEKFNMQPNEVAKIGVEGMFNQKAEIIPGLLNKLSATGSRYINKSLIERITAGLYKKVK